MSGRSNDVWPDWGQGNSQPLRSSSQPSPVQSPGSGYHIPVQTGLERYNNLPSWPSRQQDLNARFGAPSPRWLSEGTSATRPYSRSMTGFSFEQFSPQILLVSNLGRGMNPGRVIRFPQGHHQPPRYQDQRDSFGIPRRENTEDDSRLTKLQQEQALKKLKKEIYGPKPKTLMRKVSLYYREANRDNNDDNFRSVSKYTDEDGKRCAVCLDDFDPGTEVMVTPCGHMFHEDCIVPWVKSHGQCPVCRYDMYEQTRGNASSAIVRREAPMMPVVGGNDDPFIASRLLSIIRAMDEAFLWGTMH